MNAESTLKAVRELSERALLRPAPKHLRVGGLKPEERGVKRAVMAYEDFCPIKIGGAPGRASGHKSRKRTEGEPAAGEKDFLRVAVEKTAA